MSFPARLHSFISSISPPVIHRSIPIRSCLCDLPPSTDLSSISSLQSSSRMVHVSGIFMFIATIAIASALPTNETSGLEILVAPVQWYQGSLNFQDRNETTDGSCGSTQVSSGYLTGEQCTNLHTIGMGIQQDAVRDCVFKFWSGSTACGADSSAVEIAVPRGSGITCINTGVLDGGKWYRASGIYSC